MLFPILSFPPPVKAIVLEREDELDETVVLLNDMVDKSNKTEGYPKLIEFEHTSVEVPAHIPRLGWVARLYFLRLSKVDLTPAFLNSVRVIWPTINDGHDMYFGADGQVWGFENSSGPFSCPNHHHQAFIFH